MFNKSHEVTVESGCVVSFVRVLGSYGVRFEMSDEWYNVDQIDPNSKRWYRTFKVYATKKQMETIIKEAKQRR